MITTLRFANFRGFTDLNLAQLQRVNLVVGPNNAGKTSLLEGVFLAANPLRLLEMPGLLRANSGNVAQRYFRWLVQDKGGSGEALLELFGPDAVCKVMLRGGRSSLAGPLPQGWFSISGLPGLNVFDTKNRTRLSCRVISAQTQLPEPLVKMFAQAVKRKGGEERIERLLRSVDDRIQKVRIEPAEDGNHIVVDVGLSEMLPLYQMGQGVYRLLGVFAELIGEQPQLCIIDEIENGVHTSLLEQMWTGLAAVAEEARIQIFATTQSLECVRAAHAAFSKRATYDFSIIQLLRDAGAAQGRVLTHKLIENAMTNGIDLC